MLWKGISAGEGRYVVCCVLKIKLDRREKGGLETASCDVGRTVVLPSM